MFSMFYVVMTKVVFSYNKTVYVAKLLIEKMWSAICGVDGLDWIAEIVFETVVFFFFSYACHER